MKKIFTLLAVLMIGTATTFAQKFVDANGDEIADGTALTMNQAEDDGFGGIEVPLKGLYISGASSATLTATIEEMPEGSSFACCVGSNCRNLSKAGSLSITGISSLGKTEINNTEWLPAAYGSCKVTFNIKNGSTLGSGKTVYVNFVYADPASISGVTVNEANYGKAYNVAGQRVNSDAKGIVIRNGKKYIAK